MTTLVPTLVPCGTDLYAMPGDTQVTCPACGARYDVAERRAWLLDAAEDRLATTTEIARAITTLAGQDLTTERLRQWAARGRLTVRARTPDDRPLYRVGDVLSLLHADATRRK